MIIMRELALKKRELISAERAIMVFSVLAVAMSMMMLGGPTAMARITQASNIEVISVSIEKANQIYYYSVIIFIAILVLIAVLLAYAIYVKRRLRKLEEMEVFKIMRKREKEKDMLEVMRRRENDIRKLMRKRRKYWTAPKKR